MLRAIFYVALTITAFTIGMMIGNDVLRMIQTPKPAGS